MYHYLHSTWEALIPMSLFKISKYEGCPETNHLSLTWRDSKEAKDDGCINNIYQRLWRRWASGDYRHCWCWRWAGEMLHRWGDGVEETVLEPSEFVLLLSFSFTVTFIQTWLYIETRKQKHIQGSIWADQRNMRCCWCCRLNTCLWW